MLAQLELLSEGEENRHEHSEIELVYVIDGSCRTEYQEKTYILEKGDILLVNTGRVHRISVEEHSFVCKINYNYYTICRQLEEDYILFECNRVNDNGDKYKELEKQIKLVLMEYAGNHSRQLFRLYGLYEVLLSDLIDNFKISSLSVKNIREWEDEQKIALIKNYINENYADGVNLAELADKLCISVSAVSRYFLKQTGESFAKYVRKFRLQKVVEQLMETDKTVTHIAVDCGFSTPSVMNKDFKEFYHMTPREYRERYKRAASVKNIQADGKKRERLKHILQIQNEKAETETEKELIRADAAQYSAYKNWRAKIVNAGEANVLLNTNMQRHILTFKEKLGMEYVRIWSLFSEKMMITDSKNNDFNFFYVDTVLDFCVEHDIKVFFDLSQRTYLAMSSEKKHIYKRENGIEFSSEYEWIETMERFFKHIRRRYGEDTINQWIFEFTFFLNERPYYISENYSSRHVWKSGYGIVRKYAPKAKIAGPGLQADIDEELMEHIVEAFFSTGQIPDIFTSFNFPYRPTDKENQYQKLSNHNYLEKQIQIIKKVLQKHQYKGEYYVTDWNNSLANRNYVQDSCYRGTFLMKNILDNMEEVDALGIWYASDLLNLYYDSNKLLSGSGGLISKDGICKPAFYGLMFLNEIGSFRIAQGENYIMTKDHEETIYILCYNNKSLSVQYYLSEEDIYKPEEVTKLFDNKEILSLRFELENLKENGKYLVCQKIVNEKSGNIWDKWKAMHFEAELSYDVMNYIKQTTVPEVMIEHMKVQKHRLQLNIEMQPHEMRWIAIKKD